MFCQNCGAELRLETGFCAVCGTSAPRPQLHREPQQDRENKATRLTVQPQNQSATSQAYTPPAGSSLLGSGPTASRPAQQPDPRHIRSFQAIRQASGQRATMRSLPPVASLAVPSSPPAQNPPLAAEPLPAQTHAGWPAPQAAPAPMPPASMPHPATATPTYSNGYAPASPSAPIAHPSSNGHHPTAPIANGHVPAAQANGHVPQNATASTFAGYGPQTISPATGIHLPTDTPNRLALAAIAGMLLSFFLPWLIISGSRATPFSAGWSVIVPLAAIVAVGLTILMPERTLFTRFLLTLPFALGCFALGCALVIFLVSTAIASYTVGTAYLGIDLGFVLFTLAALLLIAAGYLKLLREIPMFQAGHITPAPLPGMLGRGAINHSPRPVVSQQPTPRDSNLPT
jgi:hypothetical protein